MPLGVRRRKPSARRPGGARSDFRGSSLSDRQGSDRVRIRWEQNKMPEEMIDHDRRRLLGTFFASSAIAVAAAELALIDSAEARSSKDGLTGATPNQLPTPTQRKERQMEHPTLYHATQIDGLSIFYREAGPKNAPTLLLLHGLPSSARFFEPLFARLSDRYHLVAPDYPGFGHS